MNKDDIEKYVKFVEKMIEDNFTNKDRKEKVLKMLEEIGHRYFLAPASSKKDFHSAFPGGLVFHSIGVLKNAMKVTSAMKIEESEISKESLVLVSLFHDLGKIGTLEKDFYVEQTNEWRQKNLGEFYTVNKDLADNLTHAQRSVRLLSQFGITLTDDEYAAILFHDGHVLESNRSSEATYSSNKLLRIMQFADVYSTFCEEKM